VSDFYIGRYEVTQAEWQAVTGSNPSVSSACGPNCPVDSVSMGDIQNFISNLNWRAGTNYRLPTEAEWEYAARSGGQSQTFSGGNGADPVAWYSANSNNMVHPVGQKQPNGLGLYDMSGNIWEWVSDWYGPYNGAPQTNPTGPSSGYPGYIGVCRGGSWGYGASSARAADRYSIPSGDRSFYMGFRLAAPAQ
jgi:formylglycine-generating enzyme required for sulfatase activity